MSDRVARAAGLVAVPAIVAFAIGLGAGVGDAQNVRVAAGVAGKVDARKADGSTPLQWAVYEGDVAEVRRLLDAGAEALIENDYGATPKILAA